MQTLSPVTNLNESHTSYPVISQILLHGCIEGGDSMLTSEKKRYQGLTNYRSYIEKEGQIKELNNTKDSCENYMPAHTKTTTKRKLQIRT